MSAAKMDHPMLPGETWEDYGRRLERRIKNQRDHIGSLIALQLKGNRRLRKKIDLAERAIGRAAIAAERRKEQRDAVIAERDRLRALSAAVLAHPTKPGKPWRYEADPVMAGWYEEIRAALLAAAVVSTEPTE